MKIDKNIETVYDLVEQYDFTELPESARSYILSEMTETEYQELRTTVKEVRKTFMHDVEPDIAAQSGSIQDMHILIRFMRYPVQLYKVAAGIILLIGLFAWLQQSGRVDRDKNSLATNDTLYVRKTDTIFTKVFDTIRIVSVNGSDGRSAHTRKDQMGKSAVHSLPSDCNVELCPAELERIQDLTMKNNITNDSILKDFLGSVNL
jgi:hypothetical protein